jgi:hypothetical protein
MSAETTNNGGGGMAGIARRALRQRAAVTLAVALPLAVGIALRRGGDASGLPPMAYWAMKADWSACADVVVAGDSRVQFAISLAAMGEELPNRRIINYGFNGAGYAGPYLAGIEEALDPAGPRNVIVLGITPHSLTAWAAERNDFIHSRRQAASERMMAREFGGLLHFFRGRGWDELLNFILFEKPFTRSYRRYHADGWIAAHNVPEDPPEHALSLYRTAFAKTGPVQSDIDGGQAGDNGRAASGRYEKSRPPAAGGTGRPAGERRGPDS